MENATFWAYEAQWIQNDVANKSIVLGLSFMARALMEFRNSSHIICRILCAKIINRRAKNMTLMLLTRTTETLKTCARTHAHACTHTHTHAQEATALLIIPCSERIFPLPLGLTQLKILQRWGVGKMGERWPKVQTSSYKMNVLGCTVQHGDYS